MAWLRNKYGGWFEIPDEEVDVSKMGSGKAVDKEREKTTKRSVVSNKNVEKQINEVYKNKSEGKILKEYGLDGKSAEFYKNMWGRLDEDIESYKKGNLSEDQMWAKNAKDTVKVYSAVSVVVMKQKFENLTKKKK